MRDPGFEPGEDFPVQFVWKLPDGDFIRAIFDARVLDLDPRLDRYLLRLRQVRAGRQETATGEMRSPEEHSKQYWGMVAELVGKRVYLAYEVDDGRPIRLRLDTLSGEHSFFTRLDRKRNSGSPDPD